MPVAMEGTEGAGEAPPPAYEAPPAFNDEGGDGGYPPVGEADPSAPPEPAANPMGVGSTHTVKGLMNMGFLNGKIATVVGPPTQEKDGQRYPCMVEGKRYNLRTDNMEFLAGPPAQAAAPVPPAAPEGGQAVWVPAQGATITVRGLVSMAHLNGQSGIITGSAKSHADGVRWPVLINGQVYNLKVQNMGPKSNEGRPAPVVNADAPPSNAIRYGDYPARVKCIHCGQTVNTRLTYKEGLLTYAAACGICFFVAWCGCCLIPFCIDDCKDVYHHCTNCQRVVGKYERM